MALIRRKGLQTAERFLKQGKLKAAIAELRQASAGEPNDLLTLNRLGDLLARQGRNAEAIDHYRKIARQFAGTGFLPKAIAIHKKILRLDSQNLDSMVELGELYVQQNLHGEARNYLLHAASLYLQQKQFDRAGAIFKRLVQAEPADVRHRVRLAETSAAAGDAEGAGAELIVLGDGLLAQGKAVEAEKIYHRAAQLVPQHPGPQIGTANALLCQKRGAEAIAVLERGSAASGAPEVVGELARHYELAGRSQDALNALDKTRPLEVPQSTWSAIFALYLERGEVDRLWARLDPLFAAQADRAAVSALLEHLGRIEQQGHIPALQRLIDVQSEGADGDGLAQSLEWLVEAYRSRSMHDEASLMLDRLREVAPFSPLVAETSRGDAPAVLTPRVSLAEGRPALGLPLDTEAPAVPLKRADEEFVAGRLTQAEVLEKYGLHQQALEQLEEIVNRFPGQVEAQEKRVALLRSGRERQRLGEALAGLAIAQRAAGNAEAARRSAAEAATVSDLVPAVRRALAQLMLVGPETASNPAGPRATNVVAGGTVDLVIDFDLDSPGDSEHAVTAPARPEPAGPEPAAPVVAKSPIRATRIPSKDMLDEIQHYIEAGMIDEAGRRLSALAALGYASEALERMAEQVRCTAPHGPTGTAVDARSTGSLEPGARQVPRGIEVRAEVVADTDSDTFLLEMDSAPLETETPAGALAVSAEAIAAIEAKPVGPSAPPRPLNVHEVPVDAPEDVARVPAAATSSLDDDDDLSAITAALEAELFDGETQPLVPEEDPDQSIEDIFAAFKEQVSKEVGREDYRTHYDLGIAYKEMGLVEEAILEFQCAIDSPDLHREACSMIAMCHRDRSEMSEAARWYRQAMQGASVDDASLSGLRYDLAEVLLEAGDAEAALHEFRDVCREDPTYRDVQGRIHEIESRLQI